MHPLETGNIGILEMRQMAEQNTKSMIHLFTPPHSHDHIFLVESG